MTSSSATTRLKLEQSGSVHWLHWAIACLSLGVTIAAWYASDSQIDEKRRLAFERESERVLDLVAERMRKYEDALWAGVAFIEAAGGDVSASEWRTYAERLSLSEKYPGINGIGVIHSVDDVHAYLAEQRRTRPDFNIYPEHDQGELLPITYIEPIASNALAVGLDIAHETNRLAAARKARETRAAQITGPIVLVQDADHTPGFLFYAPFYGADASATHDPESFRGMVYAPFVVRKLMQGVLAQESRHINIRILDGADVLYDEHDATDADHDPEPLFTRTTSLPEYGRDWTFDIRSARSFRSFVSSAQPMTILIGGLIIDALLIGLFILITRANRRALAYADAVTAELEDKAHNLEVSNQELERFAYVASHDLQEPLRMVGSFAELLNDTYKGKFDEDGERWLGFMVDGAGRMQALVCGLLEYSRVGRDDIKQDTVDTNRVVDIVLLDLAKTIEDAAANVSRTDLPRVVGDAQQLRLVFQNLISNAIKFSDHSTQPVVTVDFELGSVEHTFVVRDNGIGIDTQYADRVYTIFQRLHSKDVYPGTGLGLAICKKVVERHGGRLWFESELGCGTTFSFTLPAHVAEPSLDSHHSPRAKAHRS